MRIGQTGGKKSLKVVTSRKAPGTDHEKHTRNHRLRVDFPCSSDREYLYGYATDGYRSPLWLCASYNGSPVLVHRLRGNKLYFHQAIKDRRILAIPGIHFFDAHRLQPQLLQAPALQLPLRTSNLAGPELSSRRELVQLIS